MPRDSACSVTLRVRNRRWPRRTTSPSTPVARGAIPWSAWSTCSGTPERDQLLEGRRGRPRRRGPARRTRRPRRAGPARQSRGARGGARSVADHACDGVRHRVGRAAERREVHAQRPFGGAGARRALDRKRFEEIRGEVGDVRQGEGGNVMAIEEREGRSLVETEEALGDGDGEAESRDQEEDGEPDVAGGGAPAGGAGEQGDQPLGGAGAGRRPRAGACQSSRRALFRGGPEPVGELRGIEDVAEQRHESDEPDECAERLGGTPASPGRAVQAHQRHAEGNNRHRRGDGQHADAGPEVEPVVHERHGSEDRDSDADGVARGAPDTAGGGMVDQEGDGSRVKMRAAIPEMGGRPGIGAVIQPMPAAMPTISAIPTPSAARVAPRPTR